MKLFSEDVLKLMDKEGLQKVSIFGYSMGGYVALRLVQPWVELRIGVLTALIGAPFFVWLVLKTRSELAP